MIEGNLSDVSLPGLLQFLATESNKSFKVSLESGTQKGELLVSAGLILSANFGLLEGNDALTELLFWPEGNFKVERLDGEQAPARPLNIPLRQVNTFADQMFYLRDSAVGLNSELVPSLSFGTQAWQEALAKQPLLKEDYSVLGWITDGRTMRQAMREFNFDVVRATSSLFRLLVTGSVEVLRPTLAESIVETKAEETGEVAKKEDIDDGERPINGLAAILDSIIGDEVEINLFDASPEKNDVGTATGTTLNAVAQSNFAPSTASPAPAPTPGQGQTSAVSAAAVSTASAVASVPAVSAMASIDREVITSDSLPAVGSAEFNEIMAKAQKASEDIKKEAEEKIAAAAVAVDLAKKNAEAEREKEKAKEREKEKESASTSAAAASNAIIDSLISSQAETQQIQLPTSFRTSSDKIAAVKADGLSVSQAADLARKTLADDIKINRPALKNNAGAESEGENSLVKNAAEKAASSIKAGEPVEESPEKRLFDIVRTDPLPIVAIDIERLFQTVFHVSPFGHVSLGNDVLDADLQKLLQDFKKGKNFITVATEEKIEPAQVLHYCKYCLERGYLDPPDAVASLTADLLLGRVELEQYLLQRRRINGDELRDVIEVARQKGIKLTDLLVKLGFMTASDWDRLSQEKERFARR